MLALLTGHSKLVLLMGVLENLMDVQMVVVMVEMLVALRVDLEA